MNGTTATLERQTMPTTQALDKGNGQARTGTPVKQETVRQLLASDYFKQQVQMALPRHMTPDRFIRVALNALMRNPKLLQCTKPSLTKCLLDCSQLGLEPDGRRAHLIPFENRKAQTVECTLIVDYKGLVELAKRSGDVSNVHAQIVCENDTFDYDTGEVTHKIDFRKERGKMYAVYTVIKFKDGGSHTEVMTKQDVDRIRSRSKAAGSGPWVTDYDEMSKKTVFRRASKWLVLSPELHDALERDADTAVTTRPADLVAPLALGNGNGEEDEQEEQPAIEEPAASDQPTIPPTDAPKEQPQGQQQHLQQEKMHTVQETLAETVIAAGFSFSQFQEYLQKSKTLPDPYPFPEFAALPVDLCKRLNRDPQRLVEQIKKTLGGAE